MKGSPQEPLLGEPGQAPDSNDAVLGTPVPRQSDVIWEGTTWQTFPALCKCLAPACCSVWQWKITSSRIDVTHGWCSSDEDSIDLRRVVDLHFHRSLPQLCLGRGTITVHAASDGFPDGLRLTTFGTKAIYTELREAWTRAKVGTAVGYDNEEHSHAHY